MLAIRRTGYGEVRARILEIIATSARLGLALAPAIERLARAQKGKDAAMMQNLAERLRDGSSIASALEARAEGWRTSGSVAAETRWFVDAPRYPGQFSGVQPSIVVAPEFQYRTADRRNYFRVAPFARLDGRDPERTHLDLREASWRRVASEWELLVGVSRVFWGVTESRHLVDVVNQKDLLEDVDEEGLATFMPVPE